MATSFLLKPNTKLNSVTNQYPMITQLSHIIPLPKSLNFPRLIINYRLTIKCSVTSKNLNSERLVESISVDGGPPSVTNQNNTDLFSTFIFSTCLLLACLAIKFATRHPPAGTSVIKLQVGLLGSAMSLQRNLNLISKKKGRAHKLTETTLAILRHSDYCVSGYSSVAVKNTAHYKKWVCWLSIEERGKFEEHTLKNLNNINKQSESSRKSTGFNNDYIVVTILLAAEGVHKLSTISSIGDLKEALKMLCTIPANKILVGLLGSATSIQRDINLINKAENLTYVLTETTLAILRRSDYCISGYSSWHIECYMDGYQKRFSWLSIEERGKHDEETLVNNIKKQSTSSKKSTGFNNEYTVVTILVGAERLHSLPTISCSEDLKKALTILGSIPKDRILIVEVLLNPKYENVTLTEQEMLENYPHLRLYM